MSNCLLNSLYQPMKIKSNRLKKIQSFFKKKYHLKIKIIKNKKIKFKVQNKQFHYLIKNQK